MNIVFKKTTRIKDINEIEEFKQTVLDCINELLTGVDDIDKTKILGIGIGVPGTVDYNNGVIIKFASKPNIVNVDLKHFIEEKLDLQVLIDNNAKTRALGEYWYGYGIGYRNIVFVVCSEGIGSGIIADGNILRGKNNVTGEFGHMNINIGGRRCSCGRYGCVEAYCSLESVENMTKAALKQGRESVLIELSGGDIESIDYKLICEGARSGDLLCTERLEEAACFLSTGLANTIGIINPEIIILSGELFDESEYFYEIVKKYTKDRLSDISAQDLVFVNRNVKDNLYEIGSATLVYKQFFQD
jgi:predicted NBD/HSP70 family sugar kinase